MQRTISRFLAAAAISAGALAATGAAQASDIVVRIATPVQYQAYPVQRYEGPAVQYYAERERSYDACAAPRWNPNERYMPGDTVWRHGEMYAARRISAQVWNVNSPPEWTPNYWRPVRCR